jgi:hypothetical protein
VLELGKVGSLGTRGAAPVLRDGAVVATQRASNWKEAATALVGDREWVFAKTKGVLTGRRSVDPEDGVRYRARQASFWRSTWTIDLDGERIDVEKTSMWKTAHRYLADGEKVAESGTTGGWSPRPTLTADDRLSLDQQVFLLWLEVVLNRRNQAAIGAATSAAVIGGTS